LPIFGQEIYVSLKNQCYDPKFAYLSSVLSQTNKFCSPIFRLKYVKFHNIGTWTVHTTR
jgi:hypothetical protein